MMPLDTGVNYSWRTDHPQKQPAYLSWKLKAALGIFYI